LNAISLFYAAFAEELNWRTRPQTIIGGLKNVHPYYLEDLFNRGDMVVENIWNILDEVKRKCPVSYSKTELEKLLTLTNL